MSDSGDEIIALCTECNSTNSESYIKRSPFYAQGGSIPCQYCGGVVVLVERKNRQHTIDKMNQRRNIGHGKNRP